MSQFLYRIMQQSNQITSSVNILTFQNVTSQHKLISQKNHKK